jgi:hypothetical protein
MSESIPYQPGVHPPFGQQRLTFTREQFDYMAVCLKMSGGDLGLAFASFVDRFDISRDNLILFWIREADQIRNGRTWEWHEQNAAR